MTSLRTLLAGAVDYAGLFPPANLDMETAVRTFAAYRAGEHAWALGRFIVPVARLTECERAMARLPHPRTGQWKLSALAGPNLEEELSAIDRFNKRIAAEIAVIDSVELKAATAEKVRAAAQAVPSSLSAFVEVPLEPDPSDLVSTIGRSGLRVKARTGGITADAFPASPLLARFIGTCVAAAVPFKVTAGLHHPLRAAYRLTYEPASPTGMMFGFLNVLVATAVAQSGGSTADVVAALEELSPVAFRLNDSGISWRTYRFDIAGIRSLRSERVLSFGSCSFTEPVEGLQSLNFL